MAVSDPTRFSLAGRIKSFGYAFEGVAFMLRTQHNAWLHLIATLTAIGVGLFLRIAPTDWRWIVVAIGLVWAAEAFNTAIESLCDLVSPELSIHVKRAKDVGAGAVLLTACAAAIIGLLTFWPYLKLT